MVVVVLLFEGGIVDVVDELQLLLAVVDLKSTRRLNRSCWQGVGHGGRGGYQLWQLMTLSARS